MKMLLFNGSPRKQWNTAQLLDACAAGAAEAGAETERINLYDYTYKGCISCFACKVKNSRTGGLCACRDELRPVLEKAQNADILVFGSPVYYDNPTAQLRALLERLCFPIDPYMVDESGHRQRLLTKTVPTAMIYTMNCPDWLMEKVGYPTKLAPSQGALARLFGSCEVLYSCDTTQFSDYDRYDCNMFDGAAKAKQHEAQFPKDLAAAHALGIKLAAQAAQK